ncbi:hypothetical protein IG631_22077 [Alternaria alternata]|nr:hypothetical protein IG631_22077 [Alternaria alternata]
MTFIRTHQTNYNLVTFALRHQSASLPHLSGWNNDNHILRAISEVFVFSLALLRSYQLSHLLTRNHYHNCETLVLRHAQSGQVFVSAVDGHVSDISKRPRSFQSLVFCRWTSVISNARVFEKFVNVFGRLSCSVCDQRSDSDPNAIRLASFRASFRVDHWVVILDISYVSPLSKSFTFPKLHTRKNLPYSGAMLVDCCSVTTPLVSPS